MNIIKYFKGNSINLKNAKTDKEILIHNEILSHTSNNNLSDAIHNAKNNEEKYIVIYDVKLNYKNAIIINRTKIVKNFDPYGTGTIYEKLAKMLPSDCKIHVREPWHPHIYEFTIYVSFKK